MKKRLQEYSPFSDVGPKLRTRSSMRLGRLLLSSKGKMEGCEHREAIDVLPAHPPAPPHPL